jgi:hypothetical protein
MKPIKRYQMLDAIKVIKRLTGLPTDLTPDERNELYSNREIVNNWEEAQEVKRNRKEKNDGYSD